MKNVKIENPILNEVYNYYTNEKNYLNETITEEGYGLVVDNNMFVDLMDMVQTGTFEEIENGHYLIPIGNNSTFHYVANGDCYIDDERGNEYDVVIDDAKLNDLARALNPQYKMVSESTDEGDLYSIDSENPNDVKPDIAHDGLPVGIKENRLRQIVSETIKKYTK